MNRINWLYYLPWWMCRLLYRLGWACHCGSGAHPRRCNKHPWGFRMHILEMNYENLSDYYDELEARVERLEEQLGQVAQWKSTRAPEVDGSSPSLPTMGT